jgi:hypothetical protein
VQIFRVHDIGPDVSCMPHRLTHLHALQAECMKISMPAGPVPYDCISSYSMKISVPAGPGLYDWILFSFFHALANTSCSSPALVFGSVVLVLVCWNGMSLKA